ncbi:hypothetical protein ApDm4_0764 [Acetobacter pomorum]|nr:hypothetical protein ApDm4_0764 [Acetobacter pomorum]
MQPLCCIIRVSYLLYGRHTKMYVAKLHQFAARLPVVEGACIRLRGCYACMQSCRAQKEGGFHG